MHLRYPLHAWVHPYISKGRLASTHAQRNPCRTADTVVADLSTFYEKTEVLTMGKRPIFSVRQYCAGHDYDPTIPRTRVCHPCLDVTLTQDLPSLPLAPDSTGPGSMTWIQSGFPRVFPSRSQAYLTSGQCSLEHAGNTCYQQLLS